MLLEFTGDEGAFGADEMQHLDDVAVAGQRAARGEDRPSAPSPMNTSTQDAGAEHAPSYAPSTPGDPPRCGDRRGWPAGSRPSAAARIAVEIGRVLSSMVMMTRRGTGSSSISSPAPSHGSSRRAVAASSTIWPLAGADEGQRQVACLRQRLLHVETCRPA